MTKGIVKGFYYKVELGLIPPKVVMSLTTNSQISEDAEKQSQRKRVTRVFFLSLFLSLFDTFIQKPHGSIFIHIFGF